MSQLLEEILARDNMMSAYKKVTLPYIFGISLKKSVDGEYVKNYNSKK